MKVNDDDINLRSAHKMGVDFSSCQRSLRSSPCNPFLSIFSSYYERNVEYKGDRLVWRKDADPYHKKIMQARTRSRQWQRQTKANSTVYPLSKPWPP